MSENSDYDSSDEGSDYKAAIEKLKAAILRAIDEKFPRDETLILARSLDPRFRGLSDLYSSSEQYENGIKAFLNNINDNKYSNYKKPSVIVY